MKEADELSLARNNSCLLCSVFGSGQSQTQDSSSLLAIKRSLGLFAGMEALVSTLLHTVNFQVTVATCKFVFGNTPSFKLTPRLHENMQQAGSEAQ